MTKGPRSTGRIGLASELQVSLKPRDLLVCVPAASASASLSAFVVGPEPGAAPPLGILLGVTGLHPIGPSCLVFTVDRGAVAVAQHRFVDRRLKLWPFGHRCRLVPGG